MREGRRECRDNVSANFINTNRLERDYVGGSQCGRKQSGQEWDTEEVCGGGLLEDDIMEVGDSQNVVRGGITTDDVAKALKKRV